MWMYEVWLWSLNIRHGRAARLVFQMDATDSRLMLASSAGKEAYGATTGDADDDEFDGTICIS